MSLRPLILPSVRSLTLTALTMHALLAAAWWWLMPGGFGVASARFWVNGPVPVVVGLACVISGGLLVARRPVPAATVAVGLGAFWIAAALVGRAIYPVSLAGRFAVPLLIGVAGVGLGVALLAARRPEAAGAARRPAAGRGFTPAALATFGAALLGAALGAWAPWTQRADAAATRPADVLAGEATEIGELPRGFTRGGTLTTQANQYAAQLDPLLTFISRSPDRCWTVLAPREHRIGSRRRRVDGRLAWRDVYPPDDAPLVVDHAVTSAGVWPDFDLDLRADVPRPVFSHLNSYAQIILSGHEDLSVTFSPCPDRRVAIVSSDYPVGRPARFAALLPGGRFVVLEATSAEKGPFAVLAEGRLARGEPVTMTFHDGDTPVAALTLADFAAHAGTRPSPTAGWGVPQNAIRFNLEGNRPDSPAAVYITLAGTGVGRGYDSVGHAAGIYRNRLTWRWLAAE